MILTINKTGLYGVFGELKTDDGKHFCYVLTHAYSDGASFVAKVPPGMYICKRGTHQLESGGPFETFEVTGVPPFQGQSVTGILFHKGNYQTDSHGCLLLGAGVSATCIYGSKVAFEAFMAIQQGVDQFTLVVQ